MKLRATVIGAGVIGLFTAWALRRAGWQVTVLERGEAPREASWAGGGILMALEPWRHPAALDPLVQAGRRAYAGLADSLHRHTGIDPEYLVSGAVVAGTGSQPLAQWAARAGERCAWLDAAAAGQLEPELDSPAGALHLPDVAQVRNPRLLRALLAHLLQIGVDIRFQHGATALVAAGDGRVCVRTGSGTHAGDAVVVAAGAWSGELLAPLGFALPVEPVKGQMLLFNPPRRVLRHIVIGDDVYLVPRKDGHVLAGSTLERCGFDKSPTVEAAAQLRMAAVRLAPCLEETSVERHWAGLRPGSSDELPYIGPVPGFANLFVNTGHYRLGLTLAPASADLLADLVLDRPAGLDPAAFRPGRAAA